MEAIGVVTGVMTVISGVTKLSKNLNEIREKYKNVALNTTLIASQLSTIRAALEAIADWRSTAGASSQYSKQLDEDLAVSLNCCAILITVLNSKLGESGFKPGMKAKVNHLWLEGVLKEYLSNLEGQVRALQLLLTIFQCRSATEQSRRLEHAESRTVIEHLRAETASLQPDDRELHDAASMLSIDISVDFEVDSILLKHPAYRKVYNNIHLHRHTDASQSVNDEDLSAPAFDPSNKFVPNIADKMEGRHYQHRLPRIASKTFAGGDLSNDLQISKDVTQLSLEGVAADTPLPVEDHSEEPPSTYDDNEMSTNRLEEPTNPDYFEGLAITNSGPDLAAIENGPTRPQSEPCQSMLQYEYHLTQPKGCLETQDEKGGSHLFGNDKTVQKYSRHHISDGDSMHTSRSERRLSMESDLYAASIQYLSQGPQTQTFSESERAKSFEDSSLLSLESSTSDGASSTLPTRADSPIIRALDSPLKDRIRRDAPNSRSSTSTSSIDNPFAHSIPALETATTTSSLSHNSLPSINISSEKEVVSPPAWMNPSSNELLLEVVDSPIPLSEANLSGRQGRVLRSSDTPLSDSPTSCTAPRTESLAAEVGVSIPQVGITLTPPSDALQTSPVEYMAAERQRAQAELSRLQRELTEAKARGDEKSAQKALQKSINLIQATYLARETSSERKQALAGTKATPRRNHMFRLPSLMRTKASQTTAAVEAACSGNHTKLEELLDQGVNVNARSEDSKALLVQAAIYGHIDCMALLKQRGADEFAVDHKGLNALHSAVLARQTAAVEWLLKSYPSTDEKASHINHSKTNKSPGRSNLPSHRSLTEASDRLGFRPLHIAAQHGLADVLHILLENGANLEAKCNRGGTPLHKAIISSHLHIINAMLSKGAELATADASGLTPLHHAASSSEVDVMDILLEAGADRSAYDNKGNMPIHLAALTGRLASVKALKRERADLEVKTASGESLLHIAVLMNQLQVVEYLLQNEVNVNPWSKSPPAKLDNGKVIFAKTIRYAVSPSSTPLHSACFAGQYEMSALLLDHDAWVNAATADDKTPLMLAVESDDTNLVYLLLARNAKVDAKIPKSFLTAQHVAAQLGNLETLQVLYRHGAHLDACTSDGKRPVEYAQRCKDSTKRAAVMAWFHKVRLTHAAQAREMASLKTQRTQADQTRPSYPLLPTTTSQARPYQDPTALTRQLSPAYHGFDPEYDTFPEAPPAYVAGPSAPARLARRDPVYRPLSDS
ncbi:MAG: hypothetical protein Q9195_007221 [Heterodermia aff. obscurata]